MWLWGNLSHGQPRKVYMIARPSYRSFRCGSEGIIAIVDQWSVAYRLHDASSLVADMAQVVGTKEK